MNPTRLCIIDRDGTINQDSDAFIKSPDEWKPIPGALEALARLYHAGYRLVVVTNQSGLGRGLFNMQTLNTIHQKMHQAVAKAGARIDAIFFCPHVDADQCECRKPKTGLFEEVRLRYHLASLKGVPAVGDSLRDLEAASSAGCAVHWVLTGKSEAYRNQPPPKNLPAETQTHQDLAAFAEHFLFEEAWQFAQERLEHIAAEEASKKATE